MELAEVAARDKAYFDAIKSGEIKDSFNIENAQIWARKFLRDDVAKPVRDAYIIKLMIWRDGPRDLEEIRKILIKLQVMKEQATRVADTDFYLDQIDAYKDLQSWLSRQSGRSPMTSEG